MIELFGRAVFYKLVVDTEPDDVRCISVIAHPFQNGTSQSSCDDSVLCRHDGLEMFTDLV